jgi:hypothetical protein
MFVSKQLLLEYCREITCSSVFHQAALNHCDIMVGLYKTNPFFYKFAFRESRFCVILALCCFVFGNQVTSLSEVKMLCSRYNISGSNRIIAILDFLRFSGRLTMKRDAVDRRKITINPEDKALVELKSVLESVFSPLALLYPGKVPVIERIDDPLFRQRFYFRAGESLTRGLIYNLVFPESIDFIDRDGGRIFILDIYRRVARASGETIIDASSLKSLARELRISRSHFSTLVTLGIARGFFCEAPEGLIVTPCFRAFVERYIALYLAWGKMFIPPMNEEESIARRAFAKR